MSKVSKEAEAGRREGEVGEVPMLCVCVCVCARVYVCACMHVHPCRESSGLGLTSQDKL